MAISTADYDDEFDDEIKYWLDDSNFNPHIISKIYWQFATKIGLFVKSFLKKISYCWSAFKIIASTKRCVLAFIVGAVISMYVGGALHETLHAVSAKVLDLQPYAIKLNSVLYYPFLPILSMVSGGLVGGEQLEVGKLGVVVIQSTSDFWTLLVIALTPNLVLITVGFIWLRKGLTEKKAGWFAAGLAFITANIEIFLPFLQTDLTRIAEIFTGFFSIPQKDFCIVVFVFAALCYGAGYLLSRIYCRWVTVITKHNKTVPSVSVY